MSSCTNSTWRSVVTQPAIRCRADPTSPARSPEHLRIWATAPARSLAIWASGKSLRHRRRPLLLLSTLTTVDNFGLIVRRERQGLGLSTRDLATLAGVAYPTISRIEQGHEEPRWATMTKIAAALGKAFEPSFTAAPTPTLADLADRWSRDANGNPLPDWTRWRALADQMRLRPELTGAAILPMPAPSGSPIVDNLLAATAEKLADDVGIRRPAWTMKCQPLPEPWHPPGTPRMQVEAIARTPAQFAARNVLLPADAIWRPREMTLA